MAVQTIAAGSAKPAPKTGPKPLVASTELYNNTPMFRVGPEEGGFKSDLNASVRKFGFLFDADKDGDNILGALFDLVLANADAATQARLLVEAKKFAAKVQAMK